MEKAKVSVIIPCYNVAEYIERGVEGIIKQNYGFENMELILIDDKSTDDTLVHLEEIERKHPDNVLLIKTEENMGPGSARNTGMQYASGEYIVFADGDDIAAPSMISELMDMSLKYDCDVTECAYGIFNDPALVEYDQSGSEHYFALDNGNARREYIVASLKSAVWGRLYKKSFLDDNSLFFPERVYNLEDVFFSGLAMLCTKKYCRSDKKLYWYYMNPKGLDHSVYNSARRRSEVKVIDMLLDEIGSRKDGIDVTSVSQELEFYCLLKGLLDPLGKVMSAYSDEEKMFAEMMYYAQHMTDLFPAAYDNKYLKSIDDDKARLALKLLGLAGKRSGMA